MGGLALLAWGYAGLRDNPGPDQVGPSLFHLGLLLAGVLLLLTWVIELFEWRRGGRIMAMRKWLVPLLLAAPLLFLASGVAWLFGY
jgi:hypothetical protein